MIFEKQLDKTCIVDFSMQSCPIKSSYGQSIKAKSYEDSNSKGQLTTKKKVPYIYLDFVHDVQPITVTTVVS